MIKAIIGLILVGFGIHTIRGDNENPSNIGGGIAFIIFGLLLIIFGYIYPLLKQRKAYNRWLARTRSATMQEVDRMNGEHFEFFCGELLKRYGFDISYTKGSGDQGVDIIARRDGIRYAIQCKRYNNKLGNKPVQEVYAGAKLYGCSVAIVMTNNYFTAGAIEVARATGVKLWDRDQLMDLHFNQSSKTSGD